MARTPKQIKGEQTESDESSEVMVEHDINALNKIAGDISWMREIDSSLDEVDTSGLTDISKFIGPDTAVGRELDSLMDQRAGVARSTNITGASDETSDNSTDGAA